MAEWGAAIQAKETGEKSVQAKDPTVTAGPGGIKCATTWPCVGRGHVVGHGYIS